MVGSAERITSSGLPLEITCSPTGDISQEAGTTFTLSVTIRNRSERDVLLVVSIDEAAGIAYQWCDSPRAFLALAPRQIDETTFLFDIPFNTPSEYYPFAIKVDSPKHYRDALPVFYRSEVRVLPPTREAQRGSDPTFTLSPPTHAHNPLPLQPGTAIPFNVQVANRSERVDRFRVLCPDAPAGWVQTSYPEGEIAGGIIRSAEAIELNPGQDGFVQLTITPPLTARAGVYPLAIRLVSTNDPTLVLLDIVHVRVLAIHQLEIELLSLLDRIERGPARFQFRATNQGNTPRTVAIELHDADEAGRCHYRLDKEEITLPPGTQEIIELLIEPPPARQRSFTGEVFSFWGDIVDRQELPVLTPRLQGTWFWKARPWWQLFLLILTLLGTVAAIVLLVLWLLRRPIPKPQIDSFVPVSDTYLELDDLPIQLNWRIANPKQIASLQLQGLSPEGEVLSPPIAYDFANGIPDPLQNVCAIADALICTGVPTDARQAGEYLFELTVVPRKKLKLSPISTTANRVRVVSPPQAISFAPTPTTDAIDPTGGIPLDWEIENFSQVKTIILQPTRSGGDPTAGEPQAYEFSLPDALSTALKPFCSVKENRLSCSQVPTTVTGPGTYAFDLTLVPQSTGAAPINAGRTAPIVIDPPPIPLQIETFNVDGLPALPVYRIDARAQDFLTLDWSVRGEPGLKIELLPAPGSVEPTGALVYPLGPEPKRETISLQASDRLGNQQTRTIVVETFLPPPPADVDPPAPDTLPPKPPLPPREQLELDPVSPSELPPRF